MARWLLAELNYAIQCVGYWVRPYDMLADRRRWRWQSRQRCGWSYGIGLDVIEEIPPPRPAPARSTPPDFED